MSFYWYDFETFGADPFRDRPCQFAGVRTDENLQLIGEAQVFFCRPADDVLPHPEACLITGITPQKALARGVNEAEFIDRIHQQFAEPGTCVAGYNSIRFDDEVTRNTLYRNFFDPYAREWQHGNSRWDIIDMVRLTHALRPEGISWPTHDDGTPSFRLEDLTRANGIEHAAAHDAMSDVLATIEIARLVKNKQPRLYDFVYQHRDKRRVAQQLDLAGLKPVLHISSMYPASRGCAALVVPLVRDAVNRNAVYVYDLSVDPEPLLSLDAQALHERIFTRSEDLPAGVARVPLKGLHLNKCPIVAPAKLVTPPIAERLGIDLAHCRQHLKMIRNAPGISDKVREAFSQGRPEPEPDPDLALYSGGFFSDDDRRLMAELRTLVPSQLAQAQPPFSDTRLPEMLFRYRARNYPETLSEDERARWDQYRRDKLQDGAGGNLTLASYFERLEALRADPQLTRGQRDLLGQLQEYGQALAAGLPAA